jgi:cell division protein FtsQ
VTVVLVGVAALAYVGARETPLFALRSVDVEGADPALARRLEAALRPLRGTSLLALDGRQVVRLATRLPDVSSVAYDRSFPNTLRLRVEPEQPLAVLHRGARAWLVSRTGRVLAPIRPGSHAALPRIWQPAGERPALGASLAANDGGTAVAALAAALGTPLAARIRSVRIVDGQDVYLLRDGLELRAGAPANLPLKLTVAARILAGTVLTGYLDVSVPERPVAGSTPQVSG